MMKVPADRFTLGDDDDPMEDEQPLMDHFTESVQMWMDVPKLKARDSYDIASPLFADQSLEQCYKIPENSVLRGEADIEDVVKEHALQFLPAKALCKLKTVSKQWDKWIKNPFFAHQQTIHCKSVSGLFCQVPGNSPSFISLDRADSGVPSASLNFLPESVDIKASTNGLLCCQSRKEEEIQPYYICNPVTKNWTKLPMHKYYHGPGTSIALAFEPSQFNFKAHYQLICAFNSPCSPFLMFEMYSSRTNSWRLAEELCCEMDSMELIGDGFYMNGFVYWITKTGSILAFDVYLEKFGNLSLPYYDRPIGVLSDFHGHLCYIVMRQEEDEYTVEIYGDMNMSLKQVISLSPTLNDLGYYNANFQILSLVNNDTLIMQIRGRVMAYHISSRRIQWLSFTEIGGERFPKYLQYVNNLVPVAAPTDYGHFL